MKEIPPPKSSVQFERTLKTGVCGGMCLSSSHAPLYGSLSAGDTRRQSRTVRSLKIEKITHGCATLRMPSPPKARYRFADKLGATTIKQNKGGLSPALII